MDMQDAQTYSDPFSELRYSRNARCISEEQQRALGKLPVAIIGFGGLGQRVVELLLRAGVRQLVLVDFDCFEPSNLNRQLVSSENNMGKSKVREGIAFLQRIDSSSSITTYECRFEDLDAAEAFANCACIVDALDNPQTRLVLADYAEKLQIPLIHGAIGDWTGRVGVFQSNYDFYRFLCQDAEAASRIPPGSPSPTVAECAAIQAAETLKLLLDMQGEPGRMPESAQDKLIEFDLLESSFQTIALAD